MKTFLWLLLALFGVALVSSVNVTCANDEIADSTNTACNCNPSQYNSSGTPPAPILQCTGGNMKISISKCQLEISKFNSSNLHLNNSTDVNCAATYEIINGTSQVVFISPLKTGSCGNVVAVNNSNVTYSNTLYISPKISTIISRNYFNVSFSCSFPLNISVALNTTLKPIIGSTQITVPEVNAVYTVNMAAYVNEEFSSLLTEEYVLYVEDNVYISVNIPDLDGKAFSLIVDSIYAYPDDSNTISYALLSNGCPAGDLTSGLMSVINNGNGTEARVIMKAFQITGSNTVNLRAVVKICNATCVPNCNVRADSSAGSARSQNSADVTLTLSAENVSGDSSGALDRFSMPWTFCLLLMSLMFVSFM
ncbi:uromodulin-like [Pelobates fuscus]|uniref:uromodulin-like n=1 Tax=Pelobates fuscus TaxID=191477 RepID=UPI002FE4A00A